MESKYEIDKILPQAYKPFTLYFKPGTEEKKITEQLIQHQLFYPLIIKPDIGAKGSGVRKLENSNDLADALQQFKVPFIIQPFISSPKEIGLFYVRMPDEKKGRITGIVSKEFVKVTGDGKTNILQLLQQNPRYILQIPALKKLLKKRLSEILPAGASEILVPYGNHARGCLFLDDSHLISEQLENVFSAICSQIPGFYYGRMDIRYNTWEELLQGKNFNIIELNGAGSEPTHIYDPQHSIFFAWKEIIRHWKMLFEISRMNRKLKGVPYMSFSSGLKMLRESGSQSKWDQ